jgi:hypothetical protein
VSATGQVKLTVVSAADGVVLILSLVTPGEDAGRPACCHQDNERKERGQDANHCMEARLKNEGRIAENEMKGQISDRENQYKAEGR